jgi:PAS domain S-box-containing protein
MDISPQLEAVYHRAFLLRQHSVESPAQPELIDAALNELYRVLDELQASEAELQQQNQLLTSTRQQVEAERQRYRDLFDSAPDGYLVTDMTGKIYEANLAVADLLNLPQPFLVGKPLLMYVDGAARSAFEQNLAQLRLGEKVQNWEVYLCPRDRVPFDAAISISMVPDPLTSVMSLRWLVRDVSERQQMKRLLERHNSELEQQVAERTSQLQQALNLEAGLKRITDKVRDSLDETHILQAVVQELTLTLNILCCDTASYDLIAGTSTVRYQYQPPKQLSPLPALSAQGQVISMTCFPEGYRQLQQGQYFQFCDGQSGANRRAAAILACPIADDQEVLGDLWLFKPEAEAFDELEIRLVQQVANQCAIAIRQARLYQNAQAQVQALQKLNQLKDTFLSTVSHELRSPVANMKVAIRMLTINACAQQTAPLMLGSSAERYLKILEDECDREIKLIDDLLDLQWVEEEGQPMVVASVDLQTCLSALVEPFQKRAEDRQQTLQIDLLHPSLPFVGQVESLERILTELLTNACKYTPPGGQIVMTAGVQTDTLQISVRNSSAEISADELAQIFDKFYRIPSSDPWKQGGTGLGLALVQKLIEHIGGTIQAAYSAGQLTFTIGLPVLC